MALATKAVHGGATREVYRSNSSVYNLNIYFNINVIQIEIALQPPDQYYGYTCTCTVHVLYRILM